MTFMEKLEAIQKKRQSLLCVGLDVDEKLIPTILYSRYHDPVMGFIKEIINATQDVVCAYKLNIAFYEAMGDRGWELLREALKLIPKDIVTIGDGKRGDIGNTSERYATAMYTTLGFDATTVNPYMGKDSIEPFLKSTEHCAFVLALTSNAGSKDFQRLLVNEKPVYEYVVKAAAKWNAKKNVGLVVGATHPNELEPIRKLASDMPILIPGIGKQGGDLKSAVRYGCTKRGYLAIINASRSILYASCSMDFAKAAQIEAVRLHKQIQKYRKLYFKIK
ncbi:MAG: orotidine-5'-phosphate decarboxylase [bacterium]